LRERKTRKENAHLAPKGIDGTEKLWPGAKREKQKGRKDEDLESRKKKKIRHGAQGEKKNSAHAPKKEGSGIGNFYFGKKGRTNTTQQKKKRSPSSQRRAEKT